MPHGFLRAAAASVPVHLGDVERNEAEILSQIKCLTVQGVQLAVFPELCLTGATLGDLFFREEIASRAWEATQRLARESGQMITVIGLPLLKDGKLWNVAAVLQNGAVQAVIPKPGLSREQRRWFAAGQEKGLLDVDGTLVSLWTENSAADLMVIPDASPAVSGSYERKKSRFAGLPACLYANAGMGESTGDHVYDGYAALWEDGCAIAQNRRFEGGAAMADVDAGMLLYRRLSEGRAACAEPAVRLTTQTAPLPLMRDPNRFPFVPDTEEGLEEIAAIQTVGLVSRLQAIRCTQLVVGVSGGLDSTLALLIAARAFDRLGLDRKGIHAVTMPGMGTGARTKGNADRLMELLGVTAYDIPIGPAVRQHFSDIGHEESIRDVTYENAQARERTQILMDLANKVGGIVLGTGDLSEAALGFCTYNGDHMSMYNVNATIPKTLVRRLSVFLGGCFGPEVKAICQDVCDTPVSPELLPGEQRTEDILGDYDLHDFFLWHFMRNGASREKLLMLAKQAFDGIYAEDQVERQLNTFLRRFQTQQFKRSCMPDGPQATMVTFSPRGGWMMPSDVQKM